MKYLEREDVLMAPPLNRERLGADFGNLMVLAPHQDDESLGCGGLIATLANQGSEIAVIFVTDGSASHTSKTHSKTVLVGIREEEATKACIELGVPKQNIYFMREPDSQLQNMGKIRMGKLAQRISALVKQHHSITLAVPWRRDPHPDHQAVYKLSQMVHELLPTKPIVIEYPIWLWANGKPEDWPKLDEMVIFKLDITKFLDLKRDAIQKHQSQLGQVIFDDPNGFELSEEQMKPFMRTEEFFFIMKDGKNSTLDKAYFDHLYNGNIDPWNFKDSPYEKEKYETSLSVLGKGQYENALEIGCSIGIFTGMLAGICNHLKAVDINEKAVDSAVKHCTNFGNINFQVGDVSKQFPKGEYNLITCCEMGYYLSRKDLIEMFGNMYQNLTSNGKILLVHWTPYVPDYPLTGDIVHDMFEEFTEEVGDLDEVFHLRKDTYRLQLWQKHQ